MPRVAAWKRLLEENDDYRRWYDNLVRGSLNTGNLYARTLYRICGTLELSPAQLVKTAREDVRGFEDTVFDYVTKQEHDGKAPSYINNDLKILKSWLEYNGLEFKRKIKVGNTNHTPTLEDERVPTKDELRQILNFPHHNKEFKGIRNLLSRIQTLSFRFLEV